MEFNFEGFLKHIRGGFLCPTIPSYIYIDKFKFQKQLNKGINIRIKELFANLKERLSEDYYHKIYVAQIQAMHYASLYFPPYSMLLTEDLADDWLAIVDFHKKYARDHSLHQPLTAYIVAELLGHGDSNSALSLPNGKNLLDICVQSIIESPDASYLTEYAERNGITRNIPSKLLKELWKSLFYRTAILASLFHDIGYPWQYVHRIGTALDSCSRSLLYTFENVESIISQFEDRIILQPFNYYQYSSSDKPNDYRDRLTNLIFKSLHKTHGFPGGIAFLSLYDAVRAYPIPREAALDHFTMEWAAMGVMMHDMKDICMDYPELRINLLRDPLSAVVSLADFLEEFNRPSALFTADEKESRVEYTCACNKVEIDVTTRGELNISMYYNNKGNFVTAAVYKEKETKQYFDPISGFIDLSELGISRVQFNPHF